MIFSDRQEPPNLPSMYLFEKDVGKGGKLRETDLGSWSQGCGLRECLRKVQEACAGEYPAQPGDKGNGSEV